jgi:hypothetical protein
VSHSRPPNSLRRRVSKRAITKLRDVDQFSRWVFQIERRLSGCTPRLLRRYGRLPMNHEPFHARARETAKFLHGLFYGLKIFGRKTLQSCAPRRGSLIRHAETCPDSPKDILQLVRLRPICKESLIEISTDATDKHSAPREILYLYACMKIHQRVSLHFANSLRETKNPPLGRLRRKWA